MHDDRLAEEIDRLYESFLHTGDLEHFYKCLKLACADDTVSQTAIELIKTRFVDDLGFKRRLQAFERVGATA